MEDWVSINWENDNTSDKLLVEKPQQRRGSVAHYELRPKFIYKRVHSEMQLLNCLDDAKLETGVSYNFITQGDVDQLSYLMLVMRTLKNLDYLLVSTWCCSSEDIVYLFELHKQGKIKKIDFYVGEIFAKSYHKEYELLLHFYNEYPIGRIVLLKNHSKIFAGISNDNIGFVVQTSANMNTNPRVENGNIQLDNGLFSFYKEYFDNLKSYIK
jgi:hypothetical protein